MDAEDDPDLCPLCLTVPKDRLLVRCQCCNYGICLWCWHTIVTMTENEDARCPHCREAFDVEGVRQQRVIPPPKPARRAHASKAHLAELVLYDRRAVGVEGLPESLSNDSLLHHTLFGQYGRIRGFMRNTKTGMAVIRYSCCSEAASALRCANGAVLHGSALTVTYTLSKYCSAFLKGVNCTKKFCVDLHTAALEKPCVVPKLQASALPLFTFVDPNNPLWANTSATLPQSPLVPTNPAAVGDRIENGLEAQQRPQRQLPWSSRAVPCTLQMALPSPVHVRWFGSAKAATESPFFL